MVDVRLYVEGGGDSKALHRRCAQGFNAFLEKAGFKGRMPRIVACGGRQAAYDRFRTACEQNVRALLLIDSEEPVQTDSPWQHLANRPGDGFVAPRNATDVHCHFMVVVMESWFLADKAALSDYFGQGFRASALPQNTDIEAIAKKDLYARLRQATANCKTKAPYGKGAHSFQILLRIAPDKVRDASPWARRFLDKLSALMDQSD